MIKTLINVQFYLKVLLLHKVTPIQSYGPRQEKTGFSHVRKQSRRSAAQ